jgi:hypothetical protein
MDDAIILIGVRLEFMSQAITGFRKTRNINSSLTSYLDPDGFRQLVLAKCGLCEACLKLGRGKIGLGRRVGLYSKPMIMWTF